MINNDFISKLLIDHAFDHAPATVEVDQDDVTELKKNRAWQRIQQLLLIRKCYFLRSIIDLEGTEMYRLQGAYNEIQALERMINIVQDEVNDAKDRKVNENAGRSETPEDDDEHREQD